MLSATVCCCLFSNLSNTIDLLVLGSNYRSIKLSEVLILLRPTAVIGGLLLVMAFLALTTGVR